MVTPSFRVELWQGGGLGADARDGKEASGAALSVPQPKVPLVASFRCAFSLRVHNAYT
jgi:hypothetical protein